MIKLENHFMSSTKDMENIRDMIVQLSRRLRGDLKQRLAESGIGITPLLYNVLTLLEGRNLTLQEIAEEMNINPPTLVAAVDSLEDWGFLKRTIDLRDRRRWPLQITKSGQNILKKVPKVSKTDSFAASLLRLEKKRQVELAQTLAALLNS